MPRGRWWACGWLLVAATAAAAQPRERLQCVSLEYPPLIYSDAGGGAQGIAVDLVRQALGNAGWEIEVEILPWARSLEMMRGGQRDCIFTIFKTPEREKFLDYSSKPLLQQPIAFYALKGGAVSFGGDFAKLRGRSIAVAQAVNYGQRFEAEKTQFNLAQAYSAAQTFQLLARGRVDLTISNVYLAAHQLANESNEIADDIVQLQPPVETVTSYIAFAKGKHAQVIRDFDANIDEVLRGDGGRRFRKILDAHKVPTALRASLTR